MRRRNLLLTLTAVATVGCYAAFVYGPARRHEQNLQKLRVMGVITTHEEMIAELSKGSKETARLYREAEGLYRLIPKRTDALSNWLGWKPEDGLSKGEELRKPLEPIISKVLEATAGDPPNWERNWKWGADVGFSLPLESNALAKIMVGEAQYQAALGDVARSVNGLSAIHGICEHLASEPLLTNHLMSHAILRMHDAAALRILNQFKTDKAALLDLEDYFRASVQMPPIRDALRGDLYLGRSWLAMKESLQEYLSDATKNQLDPLIDWPYFRGAADRKLVANWLKTYEAFPEDPSDIAGHQEAMMDTFRSLQDPTMPTGKLVQMSFTLFSFGYHWHRTEAARRLLLVSSALLGAHSRTGRLPDDLGSFGELAVDPLSGQSFEYEPNENGFRLYRPGTDPGVEGSSGSNFICSFSW